MRFLLLLVLAGAILGCGSASSLKDSTKAPPGSMPPGVGGPGTSAQPPK